MISEKETVQTLALGHWKQIFCGEKKFVQKNCTQRNLLGHFDCMVGKIAETKNVDILNMQFELEDFLLLL